VADQISIQQASFCAPALALAGETTEPAPAPAQVLHRHPRDSGRGVIYENLPTVDQSSFLQYLDDLEDTENADESELEKDQDTFLREQDIPINSYLPPIPSSSTHPLPEMAAGSSAGLADGQVPVPKGDALNNSYVRVVHTNGIHHIALLVCHCQGRDSIPLDLVASRFLPASLINIRTLFSLEVLDHFRLGNLELKASAYQYYQLLRRLTKPVAPAEVVNVYHEFRRMSRLWRWMKRLKSSGYAHNKQDPQNVPSDALANFCPACPQPGINLPDAWKSDPNR
jgi:hypothetical protein